SQRWRPSQKRRPRIPLESGAFWFLEAARPSEMSGRGMSIGGGRRSILVVVDVVVRIDVVVVLILFIVDVVDDRLGLLRLGGRAGGVRRGDLGAGDGCADAGRVFGHGFLGALAEGGAVALGGHLGGLGVGGFLLGILEGRDRLVG